MLSDLWERVFANMSLEVWTWRDGTTINVGVWIGARVDFVVDVTTGALARVFVDAITGVVTDVGVDIFTDVSVNAVTAAMTDLEFIMSASREE